jgi:hypothetical protein
LLRQRSGYHQAADQGNQPDTTVSCSPSAIHEDSGVATLEVFAPD